MSMKKLLGLFLLLSVGFVHAEFRSDTLVRTGHDEYTPLSEIRRGIEVLSLSAEMTYHFKTEGYDSVVESDESEKIIYHNLTSTNVKTISKNNRSKEPIFHFRAADEDFYASGDQWIFAPIDKKWMKVKDLTMDSVLLFCDKNYYFCVHSCDLVEEIGGDHSMSDIGLTPYRVYFVGENGLMAHNMVQTQIFIERPSEIYETAKAGVVAGIGFLGYLGLVVVKDHIENLEDNQDASILDPIYEAGSYVKDCATGTYDTVKDIFVSGNKEKRHRKREAKRLAREREIRYQPGDSVRIPSQVIEPPRPVVSLKAEKTESEREAKREEREKKKTQGPNNNEPPEDPERKRDTYQHPIETKKEDLEFLKRKGYEPTNEYSHGRKIFRNGRDTLSRDVDKHSGGYWKSGKVGNPGRTGTWNKDLTVKIGK